MNVISQAASAVTLEHVSKTFHVPLEKRNTIREQIFHFLKRNPKEKFHALKDITLDVKQGEFFGIIGRNGSGKSTLLKIIAQIYSPDEGGKVMINGTLSPFLELGVGFNMDLTARENVYINATILGLRKKEIDAIFDDIIRFAELEEFVDQQLKYFSSGMQVRLAFSVAIRVNADVLLLDEVLAVGDSHFQAKCFDVFRELKKQGKTIIFVSHDLTAIRQFCDRVAYIKESQIEYVGDPKSAIDCYCYTDNERDTSEAVEKNVNASSDIVKDGSALAISQVRFLDQNGQEQQAFMAGDNVTIELKITAAKHIPDPSIGFSLVTEQNTYIFGTNNPIAGVHLKDIQKGDTIYKIHLPKIPLLQGKYFLSLSISDFATLEYFAWEENKWSFSVINTEGTVGIVQLPYTYQT